MDLREQQKELTSIYNEYKGFFAVCKLHLADTESADNVDTATATKNEDYYTRTLSRIKPSIGKPHSNCIHLKTHEGDDVDVTVDISGWRILPDGQRFETFEALLMNKSPGFNAHFGDELSTKLQDYLEQQNET